MSGNQMATAGLMLAMAGTVMYQPKQLNKAKINLNLQIVCKSHIRANSEIGRVCQQYHQINAIGEQHKSNHKKHK